MPLPNRIVPVLLFCLTGLSDAVAEEGRFMQTLRQVAVYGDTTRTDKPVARINYGAIVKVYPLTDKRGCKKGWGRLENGGYLCMGRLRPVDATKTVPSKWDQVGATDEFSKYGVKKGGTIAYLNGRDFRHRQNPVFLSRKSVLTVVRVIRRGNSRFLVTRSGMFVHGENVFRLHPIWKLGVHLSAKNPLPGGFVIEDNAPVYQQPSIGAAVVGTLPQYRVIIGAVIMRDGWVALPDGGFMLDVHLARVRRPVGASPPEEGEKWISVDLEEQVLVAWEGNQPVLVVPCSTGKKGNTARGSYRIRWKRRLQTLRGFGGKLRVEDVPWVMYYIVERGFAIHTAWHHHFGRPVSQGCVNLPRDDARWLYEWALPVSLPEYSETLHSRYEKGTRVFIF